MIVKPAIYIRLTKIASKTLVRSKELNYFRNHVWINQHDGNGMDESLNASEDTKKKVGDDYWFNSFKFTFVRNPFSRAVSAWSYINKCKFYSNTKCESKFKNKSFKEFWKQLNDIDISNPVGSCIYEDNKKNPLWWHITPLYQHTITNESVNKIIQKKSIDFVGKVENYQNDFDKVCKRIGIKNVLLPRKNQVEHKHYTEYYDDETREIVAEKYAKDIEYFGYEYGK